MTAGKPQDKTTAPAKPADAKAKPKSNKYANESGLEKFRRVAGGRLAKAVRAVDQLANIARGQAYEFTPDQAANVVKHLDDATDRVRQAFVARVNKKAGQKVTRIEL